MKDLSLEVFWADLGHLTQHKPLAVLDLMAILDIISVFIEVSLKEKEKKLDMLEETKKLQNVPSRTYCKHNRPLHHFYPN